MVSNLKRLLALFFLFSTSVFGQQANPPQPAPPPPSTPPAPQNPTPDMELNTVMMERTFMIEGRTAQGAPTLGTIFVLGREIPGPEPRQSSYIMVTAAHVLDEMQGDMAVIHWRQKTDDKTNTWVRSPRPIQIRSNNRPLWVKHPDVDVAVMYISVPKELAFLNLPATNLVDDKMLTDYEIKPGDELRCLGYPLGYTSNTAGFPVLRSGRIASYPLLPTDKSKTFLLDLRVFKGNSGGPVFFVEISP
jgi:hypothetical protein